MSCQSKPARAIKPNNVDVKTGNLHTSPSGADLPMEDFNNDGVGFNNPIMLFDGNIAPDQQDHLGIWHAKVGMLTLFDSHAIPLRWKPYGNTVTKLENARQLLWGSLGFY